MAKYRIIVVDLDYPDLEVEREVLKDIDADLVPARCRSEEEVIEAARDADAILCRHNAPISRYTIDSLRNCKVIARSGVGVDTIDINAATDKGIVVINVPSYCEDEVSDHTLALILACTRKVVRFTEEIKSGNWDRSSERPIYRLRGQTLGLVGFGKIARMVAQKAQALSLKVIAFDPYVPEEGFKKDKVRKVEFDELLQGSDIISIHTLLTDETKYMFGYKAFKKMKNSAYIVNASRGAVVDEEALYDTLVNGDIAGAGLDVLEQEPPSDNPLFKLNNVVLTPHIAWYSEESQIECRTKACRDIIKVLKGEIPDGFVNTELE